MLQVEVARIAEQIDVMSKVPGTGAKLVQYMGGVSNYYVDVTFPASLFDTVTKQQGAPAAGARSRVVSGRGASPSAQAGARVADRCAGCLAGAGWLARRAAHPAPRPASPCLAPQSAEPCTRSPT